MSKFLDVAIEAAREAGKIHKKYFRTGVARTKKSATFDIVTVADVESEKKIVSVIRESFPDHNFLAEEEKYKKTDSEYTWIIDPLDGTKEFIKGLSEYTVNIALVERNVAMLGVIDAPALGRTYYAARSLGAWKVEGDGQPQAIAASRCEKPRTAVVSRSHLSDETKAYLQRLGIADSVTFGSSLKICAVAEGAADIYPRHGTTSLWDTAAGTAIATVAGCSVVDLSGQPLRYDLADGLKHPGFLVTAPGGCLEACRPALTGDV